MLVDEALRIAGSLGPPGDYYEAVKAVAVACSCLTVLAMQVALPLPAYEAIPLKFRWQNAVANLCLALVTTVGVSLICGTCLLSVAQTAENSGFGLTQGWPLVLRMVLSVLVLDLTAYVWHRLNHRISALWRYHKVHHSDAVYDGTTAFRFHPGEVIISLGVRLGVVLTLGLPWQGILLFEVVFTFFNVFEHGALRLPRKCEKSLQWIFITPGIHRKHHSSHEEHVDRNFGTIFSVWDRLGRSFLEGSTHEDFTVGLPEGSSVSSTGGQGGRGLPKIGGLWTLLWMPWAERGSAGSRRT